MDKQLETLKKSVNALKKTDDYNKTKDILNTLYKKLKSNSFQFFLIKIKCKIVKRKLRPGFLGRLDDSRKEVSKFIIEIEKIISSLDSSYKSFF